MRSALRGFVFLALLIVGLFPHTPNWTQVSQPLEQRPPSVHDGASEKKLPHVRPNAIRKISCDKGRGTGVVVGRDTVMTADHVIAGQTNCRDDGTGELFHISYRNASQDFAILKVTTPYKKHLKVSCDGFEPNSTYYAFGYAGVGPGDLSMFRLRARDEFAPPSSRDIRSGTSFAGMRVLTGTVIPGMSGGPILDVKGRVVGINNATAQGYRIGLSRELKDTVFCLDYGK